MTPRAAAASAGKQMQNQSISSMLRINYNLPEVDSGRGRVVSVILGFLLSYEYF
jgi:hypothetical protein